MGRPRGIPNRDSARRRIWRSIRELKAFTYESLMAATGASWTNIRNFLDRLRGHGYVYAYQSALNGGRIAFMLQRDPGPDYPALCAACNRSTGHQSAPDRRTARYKMWQSIRIFRRFCLSDLVRTSGATKANARHFVDRLREHGYVAVDGRQGSHRVLVFRLVKDAGPNYPLRCETCNRPLGKKCTGGRHGK